MYPKPDVGQVEVAGHAQQVARLGAAVALNQDAALQSASWGLGQVMGENYAGLNYASVDDMVAAMTASEDGQLQAVVQFILGKGLQTALQQQDWATYAHGYNGPDYAKNNYDTRLASAYARFSVAASAPDLTARAGQVYLFLLGYNPQGIDGLPGNNTLTALHNFQAAQGLALTPGIDAGVVATLAAAMPAPVDLSLT